MSNPQGSTYTQTVYECSRQTAVVQVDNTEWINEFTEGIKLQRGDQVRLLGSFVHEGGDSNEIVIEDDQELNISYSTYIKGMTIDTIDKSENGNLMDISQIGDLPYSTDSFGIEPPCRNTTQKGTVQNNWENCNTRQGTEFSDEPLVIDLLYPNATKNVGDIVDDGFFNWPTVEAFKQMADSNPAATGETGGECYGNSRFNPFWINGVEEPMGETAWRGGATMLTDRDSMHPDKSKTWGNNLNTGDFQGSSVHRYSGNNTDYTNFSENSVPTEMYIGNMVKKFILPVIDFFETGNTDADPSGELAAIDADWITNATSHQLEDLNLNPSDPGETGMLSGVPRVGMCIATVDIGESSGWFDGEGRGYYENTWGNSVADANFDGRYSTAGGSNPYRFAGGSGYTGIPNLKSGVQSVIGTIMAVRNVKHHILGKTTPCYEIYVSDFVNPAQLVGDNLISNQFPTTQLTRASNFVPETGITTAYKKVHGAGELETQYNFNPSFNNINGADNTITQNRRNGLGAEDSGYKTGDLSGTPTRNNYLLETESPGPNKVIKVNTGGDASLSNEEQMGLGNPEGLSFLWNGTHTGYMKISNAISNVDRYRANSFMLGYRQVAAPGLRIKHLIQDVILQTRAEPFNRDVIYKEQGSIPTCLGAYIICNKDTMLNIAKGLYKSTPGNNFYAQPGRTPRIWIDYGFQTKMSSYTTRHYVGNSWDTSAALTVPESTTDYNNWPQRFPGAAVEVKEKRYGYNMFGRPPNINWRNSYNNDGNGIPETATSTLTTPLQFHAPVNSNIMWDSGGSAGKNAPNGMGFPVICSTTTGAFTGANINNVNGELPSNFVGYNTTINSIHFQQKDSGDTDLGVGTWRARSKVVNSIATGGTTTIRIDADDLIDIDTGLPKILPTLVSDTLGTYQIKVLLDNCQFNPVELISDIEFLVALNTYEITLYQDFLRPGIAHNTPTWLIDIPLLTEVIIYSGNSGGVGAGIDATSWSSDLIMIKENVMKVKVPSGKYTETQLAENINDLLHYNSETYQAETGTRDVNNDIEIPTNVGLRNKSLASQPTILSGNFVQTHIPDINYGFTPITNTNTTDLDLVAQTKDLTNELYTYEPEVDGGGNFVYHFAENIAIERPYNGLTVRKLTDHSVTYPTHTGNHLRIYSIPYTPKTDGGKRELSLIRLRGGALNTLDFNPTNARWNNVVPRTSGNMELLRGVDLVFWESGINDQVLNDFWQSTGMIYAYRTRLTRNLFANGGSCRIFSGANNLTLSWEEGANRMSLNNLYTPIRPHEVENINNDKQVDFGVGDAIPSAIISAKHTGQLIGQLGGVYLNNLNAPAFTRANWGVPSIGDKWLYDITTDTQQAIIGQNLMTILGFTAEQIAANINDFTGTTDLFTFKSKLFKNGTTIRVGPKITPAVNASNPVASRCLNIAPVQQFFVQVVTDDFFAISTPTKGNDPYYFIGSDFPSKHFHGNINGAKLPVIGICSRNFSAFNFVFDLGGSAISYVVEENSTIASIRTKIYNSNMRTPTNLSPSSSVIYIITRNNYLKNITDPQTQQNALNLMTADAQAPIMNEFYSQPTNNIRNMGAIIPPANSPYFTGFGQMVPMPPIPEENSDDENNEIIYNNPL